MPVCGPILRTMGWFHVPLLFYILLPILLLFLIFLFFSLSRPFSLFLSCLPSFFHFTAFNDTLLVKILQLALAKQSYDIIIYYPSILLQCMSNSLNSSNKSSCFPSMSPTKLCNSLQLMIPWLRIFKHLRNFW